MDADERAICMYLKSCPGQWISGAEIARRADGKRRFRDEPMWAAPVIARLVDQSWLESDSTGHYRLRVVQNRGKPKKWLAPRYRKILENSGKFEGIIDIPEEDYPDFSDATQILTPPCIPRKE